jgi:hypothetical protein
MNIKPLGALIAGVMITTALANVTHAATPSLTDISKSYAKGEIQALVTDGILKGDGTGKFNPTSTMTRQEVAVVLTNVLHLPLNQAAASKFTDVDNWAKPYVGALVTANITSGYSSSKFGGRDKVTREQLAIFFMKAFSEDALAQELNMSTTFTDDLSINDKAKPYVGLNQRIGFINGIKGTDGTFSFKPKDTADRQTVAHLAYQFYKNGTGYKTTLASVNQVTDVVDKAVQAMKNADSYQVTGKWAPMSNMQIGTTTDYTKNPLALHEYGNMTFATDATGTPETQAVDQYWYNGNVYMKAPDNKWYYTQAETAPDTDESIHQLSSHALTPYLTLTEDADTYTLSCTLNALQELAIIGMNDPTMLDAMPTSDKYTIVLDKATFREKSYSDVITETDGSVSTTALTFATYNSVSPIAMDDIVKNALPMDQNPDFKDLPNLPTQDNTSAGQ